MAYSLVGILAIFIHLIVNIDVFINIAHRRAFRGALFYLFFLIGVILYHVTDGFWGILYDYHLATAVFVDTTIYFFAMAASILLWVFFVYQYLGVKGKLGKAIIWMGFAIFLLQVIAIVINFFHPVLFSVNEECVYKAEFLRYAMLSIQVLIYLLVSIYTLVSSFKVNGSLRRRFITICLFGVFMIVAITLQVCFPLLPMYSLGYLFGICVLHTFVIRDEMVSKQIELEEAKHQVLVDPLTGVLSKHAYVDAEEEVDRRIRNNEDFAFAIVVFDLNDLKITNDTYGHEAGDKYLVDSAKLISEYFKGASIYRVGGDEFAAILLDDHYETRAQCFYDFNKMIGENLRSNDRIIIASGMADYLLGKDTNILQVFTRADREMYIRKQQLKDLQNM
ncbi:MAG: diguanylate cyclase [Bacilli bacterium]|nr:diguanylate cyclase [Bacilli bacterium]